MKKSEIIELLKNNGFHFSCFTEDGDPDLLSTEEELLNIILTNVHNEAILGLGVTAISVGKITPEQPYPSIFFSTLERPVPVGEHIPNISELQPKEILMAIKFTNRAGFNVLQERMGEVSELLETMEIKELE